MLDHWIRGVEWKIVRWTAALTLAWALDHPAQATLIIDVGTVTLASDTTSTVAIGVSGGDVVQGLSFYIQVGDGGAINDGTGTKPIITAVDVVGPGTLFHAGNTGQVDVLSSDLLWAVSTTTPSGSINAAGVVAYVTFDTAGTAAGESYPLLLSGVGPGLDTDFAGVPVQITNGTIHIVPEPVNAALICFAGLFQLGHRHRRHRRR